jgi:transcriptional regulator with XRE-family HTH domain
LKSVRSPLYRRLLRALVAARKDAGLTQTEIAARLRRPQSYVAKTEAGERRLDVVEYLELARAVGIDGIALLESLAGQRTGR